MPEKNWANFPLSAWYTMTNRIDPSSHPKHIDLGKIELSPGYKATLSRFHEILDKKMNLNTGPDLTLSLIEHTKQASSHLRMRNFTNQADEIVGDVTKRTASVASKIDAYFKGSPMEGLGSSFELAQTRTGINAVFLAALAALESNSGKSVIAKDKKNLFGFQAYDGNPYGSAAEFDSFSDGIDYVSRYLKKEYLSENGSYFRGRGLEDINRNYATDKNWHKKIAAIIGDILK